MNIALKEEFSAAVRCKDSGQLEIARNLLVNLAEKDTESPAILAVLGDVCWDLGQLEESVGAFQRAIKLRPKLEAVSLGLFHCLWELERRDEAMGELVRFQTISDSENYHAIVKEINEKSK